MIGAGMILDVVNGLFGNLVGIGRDWLASKRKIAEAQVENALAIEKAKTDSIIKVAEAGELHKINWEQIQATASKESWKDEWFTIVLSLPFLLAMFGLSEWADRAFEAMRAAPDWYTYSFLVAVGASFGVRVWENFVKPKDQAK